MANYLVAGGVFRDLDGNESFTLVCPAPGELPYVMSEGESSYFKLIWQDAHLYQVENDYSLALVAPSAEALQWGVLAPEKVTPDPTLCKKLKTAFKALSA
jgi:hypothetical protein|uniref:Uncharacterized protein n=1 Tax=Desulfobacca acetoxidans TaxID=60893 RepID=A0A7V6DNM4_9BACT